MDLFTVAIHTPAAVATHRLAVDGPTKPAQSTSCLMGLFVQAYLPHVLQLVWLFAAVNDTPAAAVPQRLAVDGLTQPAESASLSLGLAAASRHVTCVFFCCVK